MPTRRRRVAALLAALAVGGLVPAAPASAAETPGLLHVDGTRLRDADGRDVILRGIAVINKKPPFYPDVDASDFRRIRDLGLNHIRLGISWAGIMRARARSTIRTADPDAIGFVEPSVLKTVTLVSPPPAGMLPANSVYSPHLYGPWDATSECPELEQTRVLADTSFAASRRDAEGAGVPLWVGEWGVFTSAGGAAEFATHVYDLTDDARAGNAIWEYGDAAYGPYDPATWQPTRLYDAVLRPYPEAVPGTLTGISYDTKARTLDVQWEKGSAGTVRLRVPKARYPDGVTVTGSEQWQWNADTSVLTAQVPGGDGHLRLTPR